MTLRPLRPGEKAMIALRMRSERGVNRTTAQPILEEATPFAAKYAELPVVQGSRPDRPPHPRRQRTA